MTNRRKAIANSIFVAAAPRRVASRLAHFGSPVLERFYPAGTATRPGELNLAPLTLMRAMPPKTEGVQGSAPGRSGMSRGKWRCVPTIREPQRDYSSCILRRQQCLNFLPLWQGQGSFRPTRPSRRGREGRADPLERVAGGRSLGS